jgi:hypothetical protein
MNRKILAVTGFPRSGTTLTMRMLYVAGVPVMASSKISFEHEALEGFPRLPMSWWEECQGGAVKILEPHRHALPLEADFDFVWCRRDPLQQGKSQLKLLGQWMGLARQPGDLMRMAQGNLRDTPLIQAGLQEHWPNAKFMVLFFEQTLAQPRETAKQLCHWAGLEPTEARVALMAAQVLPRGPGCYPGMLEDLLTEPKLP